MRISTANVYDKGIDTLNKRQAELAEVQEQLTTGKRVQRASDDPASAARAERATATLERALANQRGVEASRVAMTQAESTLGDAGLLMQRARELLVAAGNAGYSDSERVALGAELRSIRTQLFTLANQGDGAGNHLFGGQGGAQKPFIDAPGGVQYAAVPGQALTEASTGLPLSTDGRAAWLTAPTGNGVFVTSAAPTVLNAVIDNGRVVDPGQLTGSDYTLQFAVAAGVTTYAVLKDGLPTAVTAAPYVSGQAITVDGMTVSVSGTPASGDQFQIAPSTPTLSVFGMLDRAAAALSVPGRTASQIAQANADALRDADAVLGTLVDARAAVGAVLNRIDSETDRLETQKVASRTERSNAEDVDLVHAFSEVQSKQSGYDAALKSYAMVQRLSLFQYVNGG
jgi:flagellar hook-associated protein 3 FlgL